eukprot:TRINITY_DN9935_c0_g1_i1.p1 TRINITY_DN9935_c0_g1~~TRINITY_DN9935_c0_g1_i1.p1  ORF type:complete len:523 (+),score=55.68 TRINITY_DN9935_c0_g1_i1:39-1571(+)
MTNIQICEFSKYCNMGMLRVGDVVVGRRFIRNTTKMRPFEERAIIVGVRDGEVMAVLEAVELQVMPLESMGWVTAEIEDNKRKVRAWSPSDIVDSISRTQPLWYKLDHCIPTELINRLCCNISLSSDTPKPEDEEAQRYRDKVKPQNYIKAFKSQARSRSKHLFFQELYTDTGDGDVLEGDLLTDWFLFNPDCHPSPESLERKYLDCFIRNYELDMGRSHVSSFNACYAIAISCSEDPGTVTDSVSTDSGVELDPVFGVVTALAVAAVAAASRKNIFVSLPTSIRSIGATLDGERIERIKLGLKKADHCCFRYSFSKAEHEKQRDTKNVVGRATQRIIERGSMEVFITSHQDDILACTSCGKVCIKKYRGEHLCTKKNFFKNLTHQTLTPLSCAISCAVGPQEGLDPRRSLQKLLEVCKYYSFTTQSHFLLMKSFASLEVSLTIPYPTHEPLFLRESPYNKKRSKSLPSSFIVTAHVRLDEPKEDVKQRLWGIVSDRLLSFLDSHCSVVL